MTRKTLLCGQRRTGKGWMRRVACFSFGATCAGAALFSGISDLYAAPIVHGDYIGATVDYLGVQEESATDPGATLFAAPTISGDSLDFNPTNFAATASGANGNDITDSNLQFDVMAHAGKGIQSLSITEAGDASLAGFSNDALASVTTNVFVDILELNGTTPVSINVQADLAFSPSNGTYQLSVVGGPTFNTAWSGNVLLDLSSYLPNTSDLVTKIHVSLDNTLTALSQDGTSAFIQKKDADASAISIDINTLPEPTSLLVALTGVAAVFGLRRRNG
ncbi:MAG: hypothetical protein KDA61_07295 [Planctomycetales bacterium]|nr:hypothetical protein [Planctomycetales bacterium]